jgi:hypothetical protein
MNSVQHTIVFDHNGDYGVPPAMGDGAAAPEMRMGMMSFEVCRSKRDARWSVRLGDAVYGFYLDKEQALLDAVEAARDALQSGREAQVWLRERSNAARIL